MTDEPTTLEAWLDKLRAVPCVNVRVLDDRVLVSVQSEFLEGDSTRGGLVETPTGEAEQQRATSGKKLWRAVGRTLHDDALDRERWREYFPDEFALYDSLAKEGGEQ